MQWNFLKQFGDGKHIVYSAFSNSALREAHWKTHKVAALPVYHFDKAKAIVSFGADFLGTWISPVQFTGGYSEARNLQEGKHDLSCHIQFESRLSLAGSNADRRIKVSPAQEMDALLLLAEKGIAELVMLQKQSLLK